MTKHYLHFQPTSAQVRVYDVENGYDSRVPYIGIMNISFITEKAIYLSGAHGTITRQSYNEFISLMKSMGVQQVMYEHKGKFITKDI